MICAYDKLQSHCLKPRFKDFFFLNNNYTHSPRNRKGRYTRSPRNHKGEVILLSMNFTSDMNFIDRRNERKECRKFTIRSDSELSPAMKTRQRSQWHETGEGLPRPSDRSPWRLCQECQEGAEHREALLSASARCRSVCHFFKEVSQDQSRRYIQRQERQELN